MSPRVAIDFPILYISLFIIMGIWGRRKLIAWGRVKIGKMIWQLEILQRRWVLEGGRGTRDFGLESSGF